MADILITSEYFGKFAPDGEHILKEAGHRVIANPYGHKYLSEEEILPYAPMADAMICDLEKINQRVIDAARKLRIISRRGVGIDSVDWKYAASKGIEVARTLDVVEAPVAELVMGYILAFSRRISEMNQCMHEGHWERVDCTSVDGKILGIVGLGRIGCEVARRARVFGMRVVYSDTIPNERAERDFGAEHVEFEVLLAMADFISIHVPLTDTTENLFNAHSIAQMKPTAYLINTARGAVVNEADLANELKKGTIAGAAVDVYAREPEIDSPLRTVKSALLTPHVGTFTKEIFIKMDVVAAQNIIRFFDGE